MDKPIKWITPTKDEVEYLEAEREAFMDAMFGGLKNIFEKNKHAEGGKPSA